MKKVDEVLKFIDKASLFEKNIIVTELLKDFRLENSFKDFYEEQYKKDKIELMERILEEVEFDLKNKVMLLEKDNNALKQQMNLIHESYKLQMNSLTSQLKNYSSNMQKAIEGKNLEIERIRKQEIVSIKNKYTKELEELTQEMNKKDKLYKSLLRESQNLESKYKKELISILNEKMDREARVNKEILRNIEKGFVKDFR